MSFMVPLSPRVADQSTATPRWVRPALLSVAAAAAVLYAWRMGANGLHPYYAPAVKSMSVSWKAFFYGGYDPAASITLDKVPGAFMVQALSARIFGFHTWSVLLPQLLASVLTVLVLYRVVRRWQGPVAGFTAATLYAMTPIVAALARAEVSDTVLVLLLVLAADAWQRAVGTARLAPLVWCGVWVGLAFQTKMVQAWGVLPAFALVYLLAAPTTLGRRLGQLGVAGLVTGAVSMLWIAMVALTPVSSRPYIDGSPDSSVWWMVFRYNLFERYGGDDPGPGPVWWYMLGDGTAPQVGWLYPVALAGLVFGVWWRGRAARTDIARAGFLMWGLWLVVHAVAFSTGRVAHVFYVVAVAPAVAALAAGGVVTLWAAYRARMGVPPWRRWVLPATAAATAGWAGYLSLRFPDFLPWMSPVVVAAGAVATVGLVLAALMGRRPVLARLLAVVGAAAGVAAALAAPAAWSVSTMDSRYAGTTIGPAAGAGGDFAAGGGKIYPGKAVPGGAPPPVGGPPPGARMGAGGPLLYYGGPDGGSGPVYNIGPGGKGAGPGGGMSDRPSQRAQQLLDYLKSQHHGEKYLVAAQGAETAGELLLSGESVLPMGGFGGRAPFPTTGQLAAMVASGQIRFVLIGSGRPEAAGWSAWVTGHCRTVEPGAYGGQQRGEVLYDCATK